MDPNTVVTNDTSNNTTCSDTVTVTGATITVNKVLVPSGDSGKFNLQIDGTTQGTGQRRKRRQHWGIHCEQRGFARRWGDGSHWHEP